MQQRQQTFSAQCQAHGYLANASQPLTWCKYKVGDKKGPAIFHAEYCTLFSFAAGGFEDGAWLRLHLSLIFQRFMVS